MKRWIAPIASLALATTPTLAQEALNTRQLEALSPKAANKQAQQDLLSILKPVQKYHKGMYRGIRGIGFTTIAHGTHYEGLCSRDTMTLWYAAAEPGQAAADGPVKPYRISSGQEFHFLKPVIHEPGPSSVWQDACEAAGDDPKTEWFSAENEKVAVRDALLYRAALAAIKAGTVVPKCDAGRMKPENCMAWILENADPDSLWPIKDCSAVEDKLCTIFGAWSVVQLTIRAERNGDALTPGAILSIEADEVIIVT